jgi:hypothetical protein
MNKSQELYLLLNKFERNSDSNALLSQESNNKYPYFYLANWNFKFNDQIQRKVALQSPFRSNFYYSVKDAPVHDPHPIIDDLLNDRNQNEIIDQFLDKQPVLTKLKKMQADSNLESDLSDVPYSMPVSETFAKILIKQGKISLAISIYEKLILSKPEKRLYFALQISELTKLLTNQ